MFGYTESVTLKEGSNDLTPSTMFEYEEGQYGPQLYVEFHLGQNRNRTWFSR